MCQCTPEIRTPWCGQANCKTPEQTPNLEAWTQVAEENAAPIDVASLDALVEEYKAAREFYDLKKKESNDAYEKSEALRLKLLSTLKAVKKTKYHVDGCGTVSISHAFQVSMPKDLTNKQQLFNWLREKKLALEFLTVNHQTLNSFFNTEREKDPAFKLPGVADPVAIETIRFTKSK